MSSVVALILLSLAIQVCCMVCTLNVPLSTVTILTNFYVTVTTDQPNGSIIKLKVGESVIENVVQSDTPVGFTTSLLGIGDWHISASCDSGVSWTNDIIVPGTSLLILGSFTLTPATINTSYQVNFIAQTTDGKFLSHSDKITSELSVTDANGNDMSAYIKYDFVGSDLPHNNIAFYGVQFAKHVFYKLTLTHSVSIDGIVLDPSIINVELDKIGSVVIDPSTKPLTVNAFASINYIILIKDAAGNPFKSVAAIVLSNSGLSTLGGQTQGITSTGILDLSVFFQTTGSVTLTATVSGSNTVTTSYSLTIRSLDFKFIAYNLDGSVPTKSSDVFSIQFMVVNQDNTQAGSKFPEITFTLEFTASSPGNSGVTIIYDSITYSTGKVTDGMTAGFLVKNACQVLSSGNFNLVVSSTFSPTITPYSTSLTITTFVKSIEPMIEAVTANINANFVLTGKVLGADSLPFLNSVTISLTDKTVGGPSLQGTKTTTTSAGTFTFNSIYFTTSGEKSLSISNNLNDVNALKSVTVNPNILELSITSTLPSTSNDMFSVTVTAKDPTGLTITQSNPHKITLSIVGEGTVSGTVLSPTSPSSDTNSAGVASFSNIKILSSGSFRIKATSPNFSDTFSSVLTIRNSLKSIKFSTDAINTSTFFNFGFIATMIGSDDLEYIQTYSISLDESSGEPLSFNWQTASSSIDKGKITYTNFFFEASGSKTLTITSFSDGITATLIVNVAKSVLLIDITSSLPSTSNDVFSVAVTVKDPTLMNTQVNNPVSIYLQLEGVGQTSGTVLSSDSLKNTDAGVANFPDIRILSYGKFKLKASSMNFDSVTFQTELSVTNFVESIKPSAGTLSVSTYFNFNIGGNVIGTDGLNYIGPLQIVFTDTTGGPSSLKGTTKAPLEIGFPSTFVYFTTSGTKQITISTIPATFSATKAVTVTASILIIYPYITVNITQTDITSNNEFTVEVVVKDSAGFLTQPDNSVPITLSLIATVVGSNSGTVLSSTTPLSTVSGWAQFTKIRILSSGTFKLKASSPNFVDVLSEKSYTVTNFITSILHTESNIITSTFFNFDLTLTVLGSDWLPYLGTSKLVLTETTTGGTSIKGTLSVGIAPGSLFKFSNLYFTTAGFKGLSITTNPASGVSDTISMAVANSKLILAMQTPLPSTSNDKFTLTVTVKDSTLSKIETNNNPHAVTLRLIGAGVVSGSETSPSELTVSTVAGIATFKDFRILSSGPFKLYATSPNIDDSVISNLFTVISYVVKYDTVRLTNYRNTRFQFNVTLTNYDGELFKYSTTLTFSCSNSSDVVLDSSTITTSTGTAFFYLYFLSGGTKNCNITSNYGSVTNFIFSIDSARLNNDTKCIGTTTNETCYTCVSQAILNNGMCHCSPYSTFNTNTEVCDCQAGLTAQKDFCAVCGNYYSSNELWGFFSHTYKTMYIRFERQIDVTKSSPCERLIILPDNYRNYSFICYWEWGHYELVIIFDSVVPSGVALVQIDPRYVQAVGSQCLLNIENITVAIQELYPKPIPLASIDAPSSVSISCNKDGLTLKSIYTDSDYRYKWGIVSARNSLASYLSDKSSSYITIPQNLLVAGKLSFTLTITSYLFQLQASDQVTVEVTDSKELLVVIPVGSWIDVYPSDPLKIKAAVVDSCTTSKGYDFTWSYSTSDSNFKFDSMTNSKQKSISLEISKGALRKNTVYIFTVVAESEGIKGSDSIYVNVISRDLVITLNRASGVISTSEDLYLFANAVDPDSECETITVRWSCTERNSQCTDSAGLLIPVRYNSTFVIGKANLKGDAYYNFTAAASCEFKAYSVEASILIHVNAASIGAISFLNIDSIASDKSIVVLSTVSGSIDSRFLWTFEPQVTGYVDFYPYLFLQANTLTPGTVYLLTLTMYTTNIADGVTAYTNIYVKPLPICNDITITSKSISSYSFFVGSCENNEPGTIFTFTYGYIKKNEIIWLTPPTFSNSIELKIADFETQGAINICSSTSTCKVFTVTKSAKGRDLYDTAEYDAFAYDPDLIPSALNFFSSLANSDENFAYLFDQYIKFFSNLEIDEYIIDLYLGITIQMLNNPFALENIKSSQIDDLTELLVEVLQNYTERINDEQVSQIFRIIELTIEDIGSEVALSILEIISKAIIDRMPLNSKIYYSDKNLAIYRRRSTGNSFANQTIVLGDDKIDFGNFVLNKTIVYDMLFTKFLKKDSNFEFSFYESGTYSSFNYIQSKNYTLKSIELEDPLYVTVAGTYDPDKDYKCVYRDGSDWSSGGCNIDTVNNKFVKVKLAHLSTFRIEEDDNSCGVGSGPIATMCVIIVLMIFLGILFSLIDRDAKEWPSVHSILIYYPLTSLIYSQPKFRRPIVVFQILASELLLLTFIGAFHYYFDSPDDDTSNDFDNYYGKQLSRGAAAWALTMFFTVPVFILNVLMINRKRLELISIPVMIFVTLGCFIGMIVMTEKYCSGWTEYWISNFLIFLLLDLATLEIIYAIVLAYVSPVSQESVGDVKEMEAMKEHKHKHKSKKNIETEFTEKRDEGKDGRLSPSNNSMHEIDAHQVHLA